MPSANAPDALLLVNLGTPDAPTAEAVRRYLREFLSDRRVVALPPLLWQPLLRGVILPRRAPKVARKYADIWMDGGSPLAVHTRDLAAAVQAELPELRVLHAMRYGNPSLDSAFARLRADQAGRVLVLPLYPQYSTTTTETVIDVVTRQAAPRARVVHDYHDDAGWIGAVADSVRDHWAAHGRGERLVFSFHGLPKRVIANGDPYAAQSEASVARIVQALDLASGDYVLSYQSRFGAERWLEPATADTLAALARAGVRTVDVVCPGFAVDCLETLEEIAQENAAIFRQAGGQDLRYIPCLNAAPAHARALAALARRELAAW